MKISTNNTLNILLWVAQIGLAGMFIMIGQMKTFTPADELAKTLKVSGDMLDLMRIIGISELLGGIGLILPALLRIKPILTPVAASGLMVVMFLATIFHLIRAEFPGMGLTIILGAVALFIAWGRTRKVPVLARA